MKEVFTILLVLICSMSFSQVKLQDGTQVDIITTEALSSKTAKERDQLIFQMAEDVIIDGQVLIKGGSIVKGEIIEVSKAKILGKAGKLDFSLDYAKAVDGQNVRLRATKVMEGKDNESGAIAGAMFFAPLLFIKGKDVVIEKGKRFTVYVDRDYMIVPNSKENSVKQKDSATTAFKNNTTQASSNTTQTSLADELKKLKDLYDSGVLSKDEFEKAKKKILEKN